MNRKIALNENAFRVYFNDTPVVSTDDFFRVYSEETASAIYAFIRRLISKGVIKRIGRGKYDVGAQKLFKPTIADNEKDIFSCIKEEYPYSEMAIWNLNFINELLQHTVNFNMTVIDIDRDSVESLYWYLKEKGVKVITKKRMVDELSDYDGYTLIRPLVTDSPIFDTDNIKISSLEKILVDLACDKEFVSFQGSELNHIYNNALGEYTVNEDRMLRYAGRKEKREKVKKLIELSKSSVI